MEKGSKTRASTHFMMGRKKILNWSMMMMLRLENKCIAPSICHVKMARHDKNDSIKITFSFSCFGIRVWRWWWCQCVHMSHLIFTTFLEVPLSNACSFTFSFHLWFKRCYEEHFRNRRTREVLPTPIT